MAKRCAALIRALRRKKRRRVMSREVLSIQALSSGLTGWLDNTSFAGAAQHAQPHVVAPGMPALFEGDSRLRAEMRHAQAVQVAAVAPSAGAAAHGATTAHAPRARLVQRARLLVAARLEEQPTVAELCALLGLSRHTLQRQRGVAARVGARRH